MCCFDKFIPLTKHVSEVLKSEQCIRQCIYLEKIIFGPILVLIGPIHNYCLDEKCLHNGQNRLKKPRISPCFRWVKNIKSLSIDFIYGPKIKPCKTDPLKFINHYLASKHSLWTKSKMCKSQIWPYGPLGTKPWLSRTLEFSSG